jgi:cell division protein FtsA
MVGRKNANGTVAVLTEETEDSGSCIRRGNVYNVEETAKQINRLVRKLQNKLGIQQPDFRIEKVYIGVGGQSLHSIEHSEVKILPPDTAVSEEDVRSLDEQCSAYRPELLDVLGVSPPVYVVDDKPADNPVGILGKRIEARYKLIVGRPSIRSSITKSIEKTQVRLAGIIVSPQALADAVLSPDEKELGCTLIDFGAGVTAVAIYKENALIHLSVIPLGGRLITKDLTTLHLVESEAERLKITYGSALISKDKETPATQGMIESSGREIDPNEINLVIEARAREIVENVYARVKTTGEMDSLGSGVILAGGASALKNLQELVRQQFKQDVRYATIRKDRIEGHNEMAGNPDYMTAISLLINGTENCVSHYVAPLPKEDPVAVVQDPVVVVEDTDAGTRKSADKGKRKKKGKGNGWGLFGKFDEIFDVD